MRRSRSRRARAAVSLGAALAVALPAGAGASFSTSAEPVAPQLSEVQQSSQTWREGSGLAVITSAPVGTTFSFALNEAAHVTFTFVPTYSGRRVCTVHVVDRSVTRSCHRVFAVTTLGFEGHKGANRVRFFGRVSSVAKLPPATYRLTVTARNAIGAAAPALLRFTIAG